MSAPEVSVVVVLRSGADAASLPGLFEALGLHDVPHETVVVHPRMHPTVPDGVRTVAVDRSRSARAGRPVSRSPAAGRSPSCRRVTGCSPAPCRSGSGRWTRIRTPVSSTAGCARGRPVPRRGAGGGPGRARRPLRRTAARQPRRAGVRGAVPAQCARRRRAALHRPRPVPPAGPHRTGALPRRARRRVRPVLRGHRPGGAGGAARRAAARRPGDPLPDGVRRGRHPAGTGPGSGWATTSARRAGTRVRCGRRRG